MLCVRYWKLLKTRYDDNPVDKVEDNIWLQSIMRYFVLNVAIQKTKIKRFIYVDWDTSVFVSAAAAWGVVESGDVQIASCIYPPFATMNNIFAMFTRAGIQDFVLSFAAHLLTQPPPGCHSIHGKHVALVQAKSQIGQHVVWVGRDRPGYQHRVL